VKLRGTILFLAGTLVALGAGWLGFPRVIYQTRPQPVQFNHKIHAEKASTKCEDCHGALASLPTLDKCAPCHAAPMGDTAAEKQFIEKYVTPQREPEWLVNARQPVNVYFPHTPHKKLKCERCHTVQDAALQQDRISAYSRHLLSMDACIDCHHQNHQELSCLACHK
jgi:menaquinone reductase, multiheme cytochrome c subunit